MVKLGYLEVICIDLHPWIKDGWGKLGKMALDWTFGMLTVDNLVITVSHKADVRPPPGPETKAISP